MPEGNMLINSVVEDDEGMYECSATNSVGFITARVHLKVRGK